MYVVASMINTIYRYNVLHVVIKNVCFTVSYETSLPFMQIHDYVLDLIMLIYILENNFILVHIYYIQ
jgi:hypothetical protein